MSTCDDFEKEKNEERILFTKISEIDTVTGNDRKILNQIVLDSQEIEHDFIVIAGSPIPMLIGTDWKAWVRELEEATGKPVIAMNTKGFLTYEEGEKAGFSGIGKKIFQTGKKRKSCEYYWGYVFVRLDRGQADKLKKQPAKTIR